MKRILSWRALLALMAGLAMMVAACGGDSEEDAEGSETTEAAEESSEETETTEAAEEASEEASEEETETTEAAEEEAAAGSGIGVVLNDEFELLLDSDPAAGSVTFNVSNDGPDFPHALTIVRAASIEDLPRNDANGAVDTDAMDPADIIGSTSIPMAGGTAEDLTVDLEAGDYVFFCPIQNESQSHVGAGQIVTVSVAG